MKTKLLLCILSLQLFACNLSKNITSKRLKSSFIETDKGLIFNRLVTNRDYVIYLYWLDHTLGTSYPEELFNSLPKEGLGDIQELYYQYDDYDECEHPDNNSSNPDAYRCNYHEHCNTYRSFVAFLLNHASPLLKNYISNPHYIDYPVIGLSPVQIHKMNQWMTDRYNENALIQHGYLNVNLEQKDEDHFVTESYLVDQYMGSVRKNIVCRGRISNHFSWQQGLFLSLFQIPTSKSVIPLEKNLFRIYPSTKHHFLKTWEKAYRLDFSNKNASLQGDKFQAQATGFQPIVKELVMEDITKKCPIKGVDIAALLADEDNYPWEEKSFLGRMPFHIVGTNSEGLPLLIMDECLENKITQVADYQYYVFRFFANK